MWGLRTFTPLGHVAIASTGPALGSSPHYPSLALRPPVLRCLPLRHPIRSPFPVAAEFPEKDEVGVNTADRVREGALQD